jgi:hypothetical protein
MRSRTIESLTASSGSPRTRLKSGDRRSITLAATNVTVRPAIATARLLAISATLGARRGLRESSRPALGAASPVGSWRVVTATRNPLERQRNLG